MAANICWSRQIFQFGLPVISVHLCLTYCKNSSATLSKTPDVSIATGMKWCVLVTETHLAILCIAASLAADPAADQVAVRCEFV